jgi:CBS-domain-containing membrane protein
MHVEDIMSKNVQSCRPNDTLQHAAQLMWEHDCGCLPVCMPGDGTQRTVGVITDRDICMRAMFSSKPLQELRVEEAMARQVLTCQPSDTLDHAEKVMRGGRVRRLPVVSEEGALAGLISLADLAREAMHESVQRHKNLTETDVGDTLATICTRPVQSLSA